MSKKEITPFSSKLVFAGMIFYQLVVLLLLSESVSAYILGSVIGAIGRNLLIGIIIGFVLHAISKVKPKQTILSYGLKASAWISVLFVFGNIYFISKTEGLDILPVIITVTVSIVYFVILYGVGMFIDRKSKPTKQLTNFGETSNVKLVAEVEFGQSSFRIKNNNNEVWSNVKLTLNNRFYMIYPRDIAPGKSMLAPYHEFILEDGSRFNIRQSVVKQLDIYVSIENTTANASFANRKYAQ